MELFPVTNGKLIPFKEAHVDPLYSNSASEMAGPSRVNTDPYGMSESVLRVCR